MFGFTQASELEKVDFRNPPNCRRCAYLADCEAFWTYCPYTGEDARLKRADVEVLP